jgi:hypothetical protein
VPQKRLDVTPHLLPKTNSLNGLRGRRAASRVRNWIIGDCFHKWAAGYHQLTSNASFERSMDRWIRLDRSARFLPLRLDLDDCAPTRFLAGAFTFEGVFKRRLELAERCFW